MISTTSASAPAASGRVTREEEGRARPAGGVGSPGAGGGGEAGGRGGLVVAIGFPAFGCGARGGWAGRGSSRCRRARVVRDRRRRRTAAHLRVGDFAQPRDQLDPLTRPDPRAEGSGGAGPTD